MKTTSRRQPETYFSPWTAVIEIESEGAIMSGSTGETFDIIDDFEGEWS